MGDRVLVVDDEPQILRALAINLRARGYDVDLAASGEDALRLAADHHPDVVILDLGLPDEGGLDVGRVLRQGVLPATAIIIVLTADMFPPRDLAAGIGVDIVLSKPVEAPLVAGMVDLVHARRKRRVPP